MKPGILYIVATPIGNLEDISLRALRILKEVDCVLCEDTRHTKILLQHYQIQQILKSYHAFNEHARVAQIVSEILQGKNMALVSDSGTPGISDPGYLLLSKALDSGLCVVPVPGPVAFVTVLSVSGVPAQPLLFLGFLPRKQGQRVKCLTSFVEYFGTLVFYESPHRLVESLADAFAVFGDLFLVLGREVTKRFEEYYRGLLSECLRDLPVIKGEYTVVLYKKKKSCFPQKN